MKMNWICTALLFFLTGGGLLREVECRCALYGYCNVSPQGHRQPCLYDGPPRPLREPTALSLLSKHCPDLFNTNGETETCCNLEQLKSLESEITQTQTVFRRCPACMENFSTMICHSTCSPNMSDFLQVAGVGVNDVTLERYATSTILYMTSSFLNGFFESCSHVALPSLGKLALDASCGIYTASQCTPQRWFDFFGDPSQNPEAPMHVKFKPQDSPFLSYTPFNVTPYKCSESPKPGSAPCGCVDCLESCPAPYQYQRTELSFFILGLDGVVFIVICVYLLFIVAFLIAKWIFYRRRSLETNIAYQPPLDSNTPTIRVNALDIFNDSIEQKLENMFYYCGKAVADHPTEVLAVCSWIIAILTYGFLYLDITSDPVKIWASPSSQTRIEKDYFEERFQPFYRTEQIFIRAVNLSKAVSEADDQLIVTLGSVIVARVSSGPPSLPEREGYSQLIFTAEYCEIQHNTSTGMIEFGPAFNQNFLLTVIKLQQRIENITGFQDICFAPLSHSGVRAESKSECSVMSFFGYFQNDLKKFNSTSLDANNFTVNYLDHFNKCLQSSVSQDCLAPYGGNVEPALAVGGFLKEGNDAYEKADAVVLTFIVNNHLNQEDLKQAFDWEQGFLDLLEEWDRSERPSFMEISYRAEKSVNAEIEKESNAEVTTILFSYLLMFVYISISLGTFHSWRTLLIYSRIWLGLGGILVVIVSVTSAIGIFGYIGTATTLLTMEVIPFLILAVGVDNMFLIVNTSNRLMSANKEVVLCIAETMQEIGPSLLLTTASEAACFAIGAISDMPAVRTFALYAMVAIIMNFFLQLTVFLAFLSLDMKRIKAGRYDIFSCFTGTLPDSERKTSWIQRLIKNFVVPLIFKKIVNFIISIGFITFFFVSVALIRFIEPGLDQQLSMPEGSYLNKYFAMMDDVLSMGPNVYFVLKPGLNFSKVEDQNLICGGLRCNTDSLNTQIYTASRQSNITYIRTAASSWLDDYFDWATIDGCCKVYPNGTFCQHSSSDQSCVACTIERNEDGMRPVNESFRKFLPNFLQDLPDSACAKAGHAAYGQGVNYEVDLYGKTNVLDSYFMAYHTTLKTSKDYYTALQMAREISANITKMLNSNREPGSEIEVFPYSIFFVFYEQYLTIWSTMFSSLSYSFAAIFIVTYILTSFDLISSIIVLINVIMIVVDLAALMYWWNINLNAITLVNLVVVMAVLNHFYEAAGISVEFCSHIVHSFSTSEKSNRTERAEEALTQTGSSVFAGIMLTKIIGIAVLAFSRTQIFRVFYFRMYLGMVLFGAAHGLIFLPLLLSYLGPCNKKRIILKERRNTRIH